MNTMISGHLRQVALLLLCSLAAGLVLWFSPQAALRLWAGLWLYAFAPGLLLLSAGSSPLSSPGSSAVTGWPERIPLALGISLALSTLTLYLMQFQVELPTRCHLLLNQTILLLLGAALALYWGRKTPLDPTSAARHSVENTGRAGQRFWFYLALVLLFAALFRFPYLGFSELQDDEIDVAGVARRVLAGESDALLMDRRGPAQPLITAAVYMLTGSRAEWALRIPVVLASLGAIWAIFLLAWRIFDPTVALVSGLLLSVEGFVLAYSRVVQMQSTLLLMMALAVYCLYTFTQTQSRRSARRYLLLGALFWAFGLLAHHEMILLSPLLLYLMLHRPSLWKAKKSPDFAPIGVGSLAAALAVALSVAALFYVPFWLNPHFQATYGYYAEDVVGGGIRNNLHLYALIATFYNSFYYWLGLLLLLGAALALALQPILARIAGAGWSSGLGAVAVSGGALLLMGWPMLRPGFNPWWSAIPLALMAISLVSAARLSLALRLLFGWFFGFFLLYSFFLRELHVHYYVYAMPWCMLAAWAAVTLWRLARGGLRVRPMVGWVSLALFCALSGSYVWLVFVAPELNYALTYPQPRNPLYWTPYAQRHGEAFGFPHKSGWKTLGLLYAAGQLRGGYETNELYLKAHWYTRQTLPMDQAPRYYFVAAVPHRLQAEPWPPPLDPATYGQIGVITVAGQPKMYLYQHTAYNDAADTLAEPVVYRAEEYEPLYNALDSVETIYQAARYQADDHFFVEAARYLESVEQPADSLILMAPQQAAILSYYYRGQLPYYVLPPRPALGDLDLAQAVEQIAQQGGFAYALFWAEASVDPTQSLERQLNQRFFKLQERWFGNVRLVQYAPSRQLLAANPGPESTLSMRLGDAIDLLGYSVPTGPYAPGDIIQLALFWQAATPLEQRYKAFVHLVDGSGLLVGQSDSEPVGGAWPTDQWPVNVQIQDNHGLVIPAQAEPGDYTLLVGLYDEATGVRLPVRNAQSEPQPNDLIPITSVQVNER